MKKAKDKQKKIKSRLISLIGLFALFLAALMPVVKVVATEHGSGNYRLKVGVDSNSDWVTNITVNGDNWGGDTDEFLTNDGQYDMSIELTIPNDQVLQNTGIRSGGDASNYFTAEQAGGGQDEGHRIFLFHATFDFASALTENPTMNRIGLNPYSENGAPQPDAGNANSVVHYAYSGDGDAEFFVNGYYFDKTHATPGAGNTHESGSFAGDITYPYDESGNVTMEFETLFITRITGLTINNTDYTASLPSTPQQILDSIDGQVIRVTLQVPYADSYDIATTTVPNLDEYMVVGNFLWSFLDADKDTDDYMGGGGFELVGLKYQGVTYTPDEVKNSGIGYIQWFEDQDGGGALLPVGAELTVRLLPDAGKQLTSFTINGGEFEAGEEVGTYTFEIQRGNFHLGAHFTDVEDEVRADAEAIESGTIELGDDEIDSGTARLDVMDVDLDEEDIEGFTEAAGDYNISTFLDISLYKTTYKGTSTDAWDDQLTELNSDATITLHLEEGIDGNEIVIVHQKHDGTYEVIPTVYDPVARTLTFKTSSFSNYAIASKTVDESTSTPETGAFTASNGSAIATWSVVGGLILASSLGLVALRHSKKED